jgi:hypothetical protein
MRNPRLLITAIALLLLGLVANHFMQRRRRRSSRRTCRVRLPRAPATAAPGNDNGLPAFLPAEALQTIALIQRAARSRTADGSTFGNREQQLPQRARGYYREYTVDTSARVPVARAASSPAAIRRRRGTTPTTTTNRSAASPYRPRERSDEPR